MSEMSALTSQVGLDLSSHPVVQGLSSSLTPALDEAQNVLISPSTTRE